MVDATQNLTGTMTSIKMPDVSAAPRVNVSPGDSSQAANLGAAAPVNPVSAADRPAVQVDSAVNTKDSLSSSILQKLTDGYSVYHKYMKFNSIKSIYYLLCLSINFLKK